MRDDLSPAGTPLTVCVAENRATAEPALRILVASLAQHCPAIPVMLFCPNATDRFTQWIAQFANMTLNPCALDGTWTKYDIKPLALLTVLKTGAASVVWIDSDILVARDFCWLLEALPPDTLAVTEEALIDGHNDPDAERTRLWGMEVGRVLPFAANTGVVRVTPAHRPLLEAWHALLQSDVYRAAQDAPWYERPAHLAGDQEVFTALLASRHFAAFPIRFLRRGPDVIQFFGTAGYTMRERLGHLRHGPPMFVHSMGFRPWWPSPPPTTGVSARFAYLYNALSPYTALARAYADSLEDDGWLHPPTRAARLLSTDRAPLAGWPLALAADVNRWRKALLSRRR